MRYVTMLSLLLVLWLPPTAVRPQEPNQWRGTVATYFARTIVERDEVQQPPLVAPVADTEPVVEEEPEEEPEVEHEEIYDRIIITEPDASGTVRRIPGPRHGWSGCQCNMCLGNHMIQNHGRNASDLNRLGSSQWKVLHDNLHNAPGGVVTGRGSGYINPGGYSSGNTRTRSRGGGGGLRGLFKQRGSTGTSQKSSRPWQRR